MNNSGKQNSKARSLYVTLLVMLMTVAVVVAIAGAVAKNVSRSGKRASQETTAETGADAFAGRGGEANKDTESEKTDDTEKAAANTSAEVTQKAEDSTDAPETQGKAKPTNTPPDFSAPCDGSVTGAYSGTVPVFSLTMEDWRTHGGVDIAAEIGSDVKAAADGVIKEVWRDPMMGTCVSVEHSGGAVTVYKNLAEELPDNTEAGAFVSAGDVIACVGESALEEIAQEGHLHFEMTVNGSAVDPCDYIDFPKSEAYEG